MERYLGAFEHWFWLWDQTHPLQFAIVAKLQGQFSPNQLAIALQQVQHRHPMLRVCIATDEIGRPKFVETEGEIPVRWVARTDDQHWQRELEQEMTYSFDWQVASLLRIVVLQAGDVSELMLVCYHSISDSLSNIYLLRDIVQALEGKTFEPLDLSTSLSLEEAFPQLAPAPEVMGEGSHYSTTISRRSQPHIRSAMLSAELTQQLLERSRAEQTTVHGAISAAFLLALTQQPFRLSDPVNCVHPVNVRSHLSLPMPDAVGLYVNSCMTTHSLEPNSVFWDVARSVKSQILQTDVAQQLVEDSKTRQATLANLPDPVALAEILKQAAFQLVVTNLGLIKIPQQYDKIRIEALYAPAVLSGDPPERIVGVSTLGDRISLTIVFAPPADVDRDESDRAATNFLSEGVRRLEDAVLAQSDIKNAQLSLNE
ncbi:phthiocerol/phthiodiolone dimycocerosyl transferase family protein [Leptolyngbya sp. NIES-2104]|uniref:phthiocerol/phthiodiolone dimycocerosyl transferase family protein n=1 Tax=Leptolyngbya sp. NIES-2104 TaxID=1552121 RepID=UPI0006EC8704|nr:condensation domain-containing protein [Leptolyngbya sp. NIES-2104]GAP94279.1 condensation domain [Leptolyngbya sp. NIES-2104]